MDGQALVLILRLLHVVGGVFWVGSVAVMAWFLLPAQRAAGREGGELVQQVLVGRRMGMWTGIAMGLTLLSGIWMFARYASSTEGAWMRTPAGTGFSSGAAVALLAAVVGIAMGARNGIRMQRLQKEVAAAGGAPNASQAAEIQKLQATFGVTSKLVSGLLFLAAALMATARYW